MAKERSLLAAAPSNIKASGDTIAAANDAAFLLTLAPGAPLAMDPERKGRGDNSTAGYIRVAAPASTRTHAA